MEQVVPKPKYLRIVQPIKILCRRDILPIDNMKQDLESAIDKAYQEMNSEDRVAIISQIITDRVCHSCHY